MSIITISQKFIVNLMKDILPSRKATKPKKTASLDKTPDILAIAVEQTIIINPINAENAATNAKNAATNAKNAATNAKIASKNAKNAATNAKNAATNAEIAATNAEKENIKLRNGVRVDYSNMDMPTCIHETEIADNIDIYNWATNYSDYCAIALKQSKYESKDADYIFEEDYDDDELPMKM